MPLHTWRTETIPETMQALELRAYDGSEQALQPVERPVPILGPGEVLIRIAASPINPSDLMAVRGLYGIRKQLPTVPGMEGCGTVVAAGSGLLARALLGRRVACVAGPTGDGTWAAYMRAGPWQCIPLRRNIDDEQGAMLVVNPLTAWALLDIARRAGCQAIAVTAGASALGRQMLHLAGDFGIRIIPVVRRPDQVAPLLALGAPEVVDTSVPDSDAVMAAVFRRQRVRLAFDAVAGPTTEQLLQAMPDDSRVVVFGGLSEAPCRIDPRHLIFEDKRVEGFWLSHWIRQAGLLRVLRAGYALQTAIAAGMHTPVRDRVPLYEGFWALQDYAADMSAGKVLFVPALGRP